MGDNRWGQEGKGWRIGWRKEERLTAPLAATAAGLSASLSFFFLFLKVIFKFTYACIHVEYVHGSVVACGGTEGSKRHGLEQLGAA